MSLFSLVSELDLLRSRHWTLLQWQGKEPHKATEASLPYFRGFYYFQAQILSHYDFMLGKFTHFSVSHCGLYNGLIRYEIWVSNPLPGSDLQWPWVSKFSFLSLHLPIRKILTLKFFSSGVYRKSHLWIILVCGRERMRNPITAGSSLRDRRIHPHQNFINLTKIFLSHSACGITARAFEKQYCSKQGQYRILS